MSARRPIHLTEFMDNPALSSEDLQRELKYIRWVNHNLGGSRVVVNQIADWSKQKRLPSETITVLDVATGSADIPGDILQWAAAEKRAVNVVGLDLHPGTLRIAAEWTAKVERLSLIGGDAVRLPIADKAVDIACCSMFLHHLDDDTALGVMREMLRVSRYGIIVNDLVRATWAKIAIYLLTLRTSPTTRYDARLSVAKGWTADEINNWIRQLNAPWLNCRFHRYARFTLAGLKPTGG